MDEFHSTWWQRVKIALGWRWVTIAERIEEVWLDDNGDFVDLTEVALRTDELQPPWSSAVRSGMTVTP